MIKVGWVMDWGWFRKKIEWFVMLVIVEAHKCERR